LFFFKAANIADAVYIVRNLFSGINGARYTFFLSQGKSELVLTMISVLTFAFMTTHFFGGNGIINLKHKHVLSRYVFYNALIMSVIFLAKYSANKTFIYFQF